MISIVFYISREEAILVFFFPPVVLGVYHLLGALAPGLHVHRFKDNQCQRMIFSLVWSKKKGNDEPTSGDIKEAFAGQGTIGRCL